MYLFLGCESGWKEFDNSCYKLHLSFRTWYDARDDCLTQDSHLTSVHSDDEQNFIETELGISMTMWIGGKRIGGTDDFEWEDGTYFDYTHWYYNQPDGQGCIAMSTMDNNWFYYWQDYYCTQETFYYICKKNYSNRQMNY